tara:strand:- start:1586 stop:1783 length:198 start_codon:yes stop_codon:yes gene_type:complete
MIPGKQQEIFKVYDSWGTILLTTSSRFLASWYQNIYNKRQRKRNTKISIDEKINVSFEDVPFKKI